MRGLRKGKHKSRQKIHYIKIEDNIYVLPYYKYRGRIYKSLVSKLKNIYVSAYRDMEKFMYKSPKHIKKYIRWLIKRCGNHFYLIYVKEKSQMKLVGFIAIEMGWYEKFLNEKGAIIHEFVIRKEYQSRGIGGIVLRFLIQEISKYNTKNIILSVGEENVKAIKFYEKLGFKKAQRDIEDKDEGRVWVYMVKRV